MADNSQAKKKTDYPAQKVNKKVTLCDTKRQDFINTDIPEVPLKLFKLTTQFTVIINILYNYMQPGILKKIEDKLEKVGDVIQEKIEAAGNFLESEWNKHNFGPALVIFLNV